MKNPLKQLLGKTLNLANRDKIIYKQAFYPIKKKLLEKYGTKTAEAIQHIKHECWTCDGDGEFVNEWKRETCWSCKGTGIYAEFYIRLHKYQLGSFGFFIPGEKLNRFEMIYEENKHLLSNKGKLLPIIEGRIKHDSPKHYLGSESIFWLLLFYDFKAFKKKMGRYGFPKTPRTPMVFLSWLIMKNKQYRWKRRNETILSEEAIKKLRSSPITEDDLPF